MKLSRADAARAGFENNRRPRLGERPFVESSLLVEVAAQGSRKRIFADRLRGRTHIAKTQGAISRPVRLALWFAQGDSPPGSWPPCALDVAMPEGWHSSELAWCVAGRWCLVLIVN